jgi:predicted transcriptional regulator of viral defense system
MNYTDFRNKFQHLPIIASKDVVRLEKGKQAMRNQFNRWQNKGLLIQLKRGLYALNENDRKVGLNFHSIANNLYAPSYISLETALNFYGLIPERTVDLTSVTTKKTAIFKNKLGTFIYQHIKPGVFRGFKEVKDNSGYSFFIAEPEKAVVDFLYLNLSKFKTEDQDIFEISYRFQNVEGLKALRILEQADLFNNSKLVKVCQNFCKFIKEGA